MRVFILIIAAIQFLSITTGCKKQAAMGLRIKNIERGIHDCGEPGDFSSQFEICLTKLITDSRCPTGWECIWEGYAQCEFSFTRNNETRVFRLATTDKFGMQSNIQIDNVKIKLLDILPYPGVIDPASEPVKAILKVEY